jgi:hypothetical protein
MNQRIPSGGRMMSPHEKPSRLLWRFFFPAGAGQGFRPFMGGCGAGKAQASAQETRHRISARSVHPPAYAGPLMNQRIPGGGRRMPPHEKPSRLL